MSRSAVAPLQAGFRFGIIGRGVNDRYLRIPVVLAR
jgi:hypothetical protein